MASQTQKLTPCRLWLNIHVYVGLAAGFFFALLGLTGSLSMYRQALDEVLNPQLVIENPQGKPQNLDKIFANIRLAHPSRHGEWELEMPKSQDEMITAWYDNPHETFGEYYAPLMVSVNPYTAEVVASRFWGHTFSTWMYNLHTQLLMGTFGARTVGIFGLGLIASCLSGLYLWWPRNLASLRSLLGIQHRQGILRFAHDLHKLIGAFSFPLLLLLAFTGFHLAVPAFLETIVDAPDMRHGEVGQTIRSTAVPNQHPVSLEEAVTIARGLFPHAEIRRVATPAGEDGSFRVNLRRPEDINIRHPLTMVWIDRWSGQIREVRNPNKFSLGQKFISTLWPLHTGESFSLIGRLLWFIIGLTPSWLFISGLLQWLVKHEIIENHPINLIKLNQTLVKAAKATQYTTNKFLSYLLTLGIWLTHQVPSLLAWIKSRVTAK